MARSLSHRGPDGTKILFEGPVGLGFTRLSIVDPEGGDQPLSTDDGSVVLIANGEIYNHRELEAGLPAGTRMTTDSDCEVLLHLYRRDGVHFLDSVRGIYAVVLWDRARSRLVFARDRFGVKPLHYARRGAELTFASEIKAIFANPDVPRRLEWEQCLTDQLVNGAAFFEDRAPTTWFEGIEIVPAGTVVEVELRTGEVREHRYWRLPKAGSGESMPRHELVEAYRDVLAASVEESCMSDAEIGLFLSGGIDSAAVAAFSRSVPTLHTFTALNGGTFENGDGAYAHDVAAAVGRPNHQVVFGPERIPSAEEWKRLVWLLETPLCNPEQFYKYELHRFARATRPDLKVMLLGQASDEFNGGYSVWIADGGDWEDFVANLRDQAHATALLGRPRLAPWLQRSLPLLLPDVLRDGFEDAFADPYALYVAWKFRDILQYNCWHEDRTAAGNGIEARPPFLDHRVVELTAAIPHAERRRLLWDKQILREALDGVLPPALVDRPKAPFFYGSGVRHVYRTFARMLAADGDALLEEALSSGRARDVVDLDAARETLRQLEARPGPDLELVLRLVNLGLLDQMAAELPPPPITWPARPLPCELAVADWDTAAIAVEFASRPPLELDSVPSFPDGVLLVREARDDGSWFLVVDGTLEYVIDEEDQGGWLRFLCAVDGTRDLATILAEIGCELGELEGLLAEALEAGVLELAVPALRPVSS